MTRLLLLPGDGIGPEIVLATRDVLSAADQAFGLGLKLEEAQIGFVALKAHGSTIPDDVIAAARSADGVILGPVSHNDYPPVAEGGRNPSGVLRKALDLYANIRPATTRALLPSAVGRPFDLVIVRENTEGFYTDRNMATGTGEFMPDNDMVLAIRKVTRQASARIAEAAFHLAGTRPDRHVTAVHKANVLRQSDGLFLEECRRVAALNPHIRYDEVLVDAMAAHLVRAPERYDVIVTTNMYGDILSDLAGELSGSLGLAGSLNAGSENAMAQAQHGSAPDIAGTGCANPAGLIASVAMLLDWLADRDRNPAFRTAALAVEGALQNALADPATRTPDVAGHATTSEMTQAILNGLSQDLGRS